MIQNKLKLIEDTVCWVNEEEALFKFPQSTYQDVGDISVRKLNLNDELISLSIFISLQTIQRGEGKMKVSVQCYLMDSCNICLVGESSGTNFAAKHRTLRPTLWDSSQVAKSGEEVDRRLVP